MSASSSTTSMLALPSAVFAHRDDQYLQATLVAIEPSGVRVQINLTPGVAVAEQVIAEIDRDRDDAISKNEAAVYAKLLKGDLTLRQSQVMELLASGADNLKMSAHLGISERAVKSHITALLDRFHVENRTELALLAWKAGFGPRD